MSAVLPFPHLTDDQWNEIAPKLPSGANLIRARGAFERLVLDRHRYRLKDRRVYRAALRIWADEGGTDKIWKANPTRSTWPGPRRKRRSYTPRGAIIDYLQTVGRVILGVELKPGQARKYVQRVFRRARAPFAGVGRLTADTYVLHAGEA